MWGHQGIMVLRHILHNNHKFHSQPQVLGMCHHLSLRYRICKVMGAKYWSHNYKRCGVRSMTTIVGLCWLFYF